jgi:hypothetical protein
MATWSNHDGFEVREHDGGRVGGSKFAHLRVTGEQRMREEVSRNKIGHSKQGPRELLPTSRPHLPIIASNYEELEPL